MTISILHSDEAKPIEQKLSQLGFNCQRFKADSIKDLNHQHSDIVYFVPHGEFGTPQWSPLRVRLAQANRYYIVAGSKMTTSNIVMAVRDGAHDVLQLSDSDERWNQAISSIVESQSLWLQLYGGNAKREKHLLIGESPSMRSLRQSIERLGPTNATVLIYGESGVGKELVANGLHQTVGTGKFVAVNVAAIPRELIEAELFGAEKGAYTGAVKARAGLVEQADGGTLFLDEIGEMDLSLQPKLLRFLETRRARRVGSNDEYQVNVRVVSATNQHLEQLIAQGRFRADLFYRLSEVTLNVPPLRARIDDIPHYALAFARAAGERFGKNFDAVEPELVRKFQQYEWPGNVRELKNAIERMVILFDGPCLREGWWEPGGSSPFQSIGGATHNQNPQAQPSPNGQPSGGAAASSSTSAPGEPTTPVAPANPYPQIMSRKQKLELAAKLLEDSGNDLTWVAAQLGVNPSTLYRWRKANKV